MIGTICRRERTSRYAQIANIEFGWRESSFFLLQIRSRNNRLRFTGDCYRSVATSVRSMGRLSIHERLFAVFDGRSTGSPFMVL
ncbi:hypothetical protein [Sinorhizobium terangae]|uniref:hypothetical protein n=1 Tax=Sinorhizobium terangae TaxID=110322 RepID=UPI0018319D06|nr:hypothetical protein [Sinorhizobium terangae]MBB4189650.1 hypothetical protein [Sinorhizobium terangae]WFU49537.1 hypothetical protein QA637_09145 [Sinorhizobium terangae]